MWWFRALHGELASRIDRAALPARARVLDAGCGTGGFLARLGAERSDLLLEGLELDEEAAAIAARKTGLRVSVGSVARMPYPSGSFSAIVSADVLCHGGVDERAALAEFHRCLAAGGLLLLNLPAYEWLLSAHDERVHNVRRYGTRRAAELVRDAGFSRVTVRHWNGLLFPLMLVHRLLLGRGDGPSDVREFPRWQNELLFAVTRAERRLSSLGLRLPFGGSVQVEALK
jgi:SAM-dependent methyltransferase